MIEKNDYFKYEGGNCTACVLQADGLVCSYSFCCDILNSSIIGRDKAVCGVFDSQCADRGGRSGAEYESFWNTDFFFLKHSEISDSFGCNADQYCYNGWVLKKVENDRNSNMLSI